MTVCQALGEQLSEKLRYIKYSNAKISENGDLHENREGYQ